MAQLASNAISLSFLVGTPGDREMMMEMMNQRQGPMPGNGYRQMPAPQWQQNRKLQFPQWDVPSVVNNVIQKGEELWKASSTLEDLIALGEVLAPVKK